MKKVSFSLFLLSVVAILLALYYPERRPLRVEGGNIRVVAMHKDSGAVEVRALLKKGEAMIDSIKRPVIGEAAVDLCKFQPESPLMNFAADALKEMAQRYSSDVIDVAITNKGGLRSNISQGVVTFGDIYNVFPFENTLALLYLNGGQLLQLCAEIASVGGEAISGMRLEISPDGGLVSVMVGGAPVDPAKTYLVATSDYLSQGNDKMTALSLATECTVLGNVTIRDLMVQYVKEVAERGEKLYAVCDGRITVMK